MFENRRLLHGICVSSAILWLHGCATLGPKYTADTTAPANTATIYVYRDFNLIGGGLDYIVSVNSIPMAPLPTGGYFVFHVAPGQLELSARTEAKTSVTVEAKAGETYYVKGTVGIGVFVGHPHLVLVANETGEKEVATCRLVPHSAPLVARSPSVPSELSVPTDEGSITNYGKVDWFPNVDVMATGAGGDPWHGVVMLTDKSLILQLNASKGASVTQGMRIPFSELSSVEIENFVRAREIVIRTRDGHLDSFHFVHHIIIDRETTQTVGELLRSKVKDLGDQAQGQ